MNWFDTICLWLGRIQMWLLFMLILWSVVRFAHEEKMIRDNYRKEEEA